MRVSDFDYSLPKEAIAQHPADRREEARLLVLGRDEPARAALDRRVGDLPELLEPDSLLVVNDTRVIAARLEARKPTGGRVELLRVEPRGEPGRWLCLGGASKPIRPGALTLPAAPEARAEVLAVDGELVDVAFSTTDGSDIEALLERVGQVPLPPYIERPDAPDEADRTRYQTVFAAHPGSAAAPTAGLHFGPELLERLGQAGIGCVRVTLHVGPGTFSPLRHERVEDNRLHEERVAISMEAADAIGAARAAGRKVVAVGTTVVRALESMADEHGVLRAGSARTSLFIRPGFRFRVIDQLVTNFHLPRSSLLMLVAALAGRERTLEAYRVALERGYRFFSYGDAMLIR